MNKDDKGPKPRPGKHRQASASDRIVHDVLRGLYEGRYLPGQRLSEPDLVTRYKASRTIVRNAIKRLAAQGVVEARTARDGRIRQLTRTEARNVLLIAEVIVGLAARLAAETIAENADRDSHQADLQAALDALVNARSGVGQYDFIRMRNRFHRTVARIGGNPQLEETLTGLPVHLIRNRLVMKPEDRAGSYRRIAEAVLAGDGKAAEEAARRHIRIVIDLIDMVYDPPFPDRS